MPKAGPARQCWYGNHLSILALHASGNPNGFIWGHGERALPPPLPCRAPQMAEEAIDAINSAVQPGHKSPVIHVRYADNIKAPKEVCASILSQANLLDGGDASQKYHASVEAYITASKAKRAKEKTLNKTSSSGKGKEQQGVLHLYSLAEYGLSEAQVRSTFQEYTDKYKLCEP